MQTAPQPVLSILQSGLLTRGGVHGGRVGHLWPDLSGGSALCGAWGPPLNWRPGDWIPDRLCQRCLHVARRLSIAVPVCPSCRSIVTRPRCLFDLPPDECPRHIIRLNWVREQAEAIKKWRQEHAKKR